MRLSCLLRGGHRWSTVRDAAGPLTTCARCGAHRHRRLGTVRHGTFEIHHNHPRGFEPMPEHGAEELDERPAR